MQKKRIKKGIYIGFKEFGQAEVLDQVTEKTRSRVTLRLKQGKKREIRRIFFKLKVKLFSLKRISFSKIKLGTLKEGEYRELRKNEISLLRKLLYMNNHKFFYGIKLVDNLILITLFLLTLNKK